MLGAGRSDDDVSLIVAHGAWPTTSVPGPLSAASGGLGGPFGAGVVRPVSTAEAVVPVRDGQTTLGALW